MIWRSRVASVLKFGMPISRLAVPLLNGLARRQLLRAGVAEREVRLNGMSINYYLKAPLDAAALPIVLVHGIADNALTWSLVFNPLARAYPVYAIDLPGYGYSGLPTGRTYTTLDEMREVLAEFLRDVVGRPALVVGNSMGGWLAVKLAGSVPELLRGILLLNAGGAPLKGLESWLPFAETIGVPDMKAARAVFRQMFGAIPAPLLYLGQHSLQEVFQRQVVREFVTAMMMSAPEKEFLHPDDLWNLPVPAALIWGLADRFLPPGSFEFFHENMPGAPALLLKRCGHLPQRERSLPVLRFIKKFAAQLTQAEQLGRCGGLGATPPLPNPHPEV